MKTPMTNDSQDQAQTAEVAVRWGNFALHGKLETTPAGLLAVGGLVGCILLSTAALVWTATAVPRKHPLSWALTRR